MDWTIVVSVIVALLLWPLAAMMTALPLLVLGRSFLRRRLRRAVRGWREGRSARWQQLCGEGWRRFCGSEEAVSPQVGSDA